MTLQAASANSCDPAIELAMAATSSATRTGAEEDARRQPIGGGAVKHVDDADRATQAPYSRRAEVSIRSRAHAPSWAARSEALGRVDFRGTGPHTLRAH